VQTNCPLVSSLLVKMTPKICIIADQDDGLYITYPHKPTIHLVPLTDNPPVTSQQSNWTIKKSRSLTSTHGNIKPIRWWLALPVISVREPILPSLINWPAAEEFLCLVRQIDQLHIPRLAYASWGTENIGFGKGFVTCVAYKTTWHLLCVS